MKTLRASFFSLMLVNLIKKTNFLIAILAQVQGALRKLAASFLEHCKENHENTIYVYFAVLI